MVYTLYSVQCWSFLNLYGGGKGGLSQLNHGFRRLNRQFSRLNTPFPPPFRFQKLQHGSPKNSPKSGNLTEMLLAWKQHCLKVDV